MSLDRRHIPLRQLQLILSSWLTIGADFSFRRITYLDVAQRRQGEVPAALTDHPAQDMRQVGARRIGRMEISAVPGLNLEFHALILQFLDDDPRRRVGKNTASADVLLGLRGDA